MSSVVDHHNSITYNYTYDDLHRLTSESVSGGGTTLSMDYDPLGNIVSKATAGNSLAYSYGTAGRPHRLTSITQNGSPTYNYAYDSNGNMTTCFDLADPAGMKQRSILYNAENMPTQIDVFPYGGGTSTTYGFSYDGNGRRVLKWIGGIVNTVYVGPHFEVVNGVEASYIFAGNQRIAKVTGTGTQYFHQDHLGSATRLTNETGQLMEQAEYLPFGQMRPGSSSPPFASNYKYTDQEFDVGTGLYNYDARLYDPIIGRFISPDSIVPDYTNPQALNRYSYVLNNPLIYIDQTGHDWGPGAPPDWEGPPCGDRWERDPDLGASAVDGEGGGGYLNPFMGFGLLDFMRTIIDYFSKSDYGPKFVTSGEEDEKRSKFSQAWEEATDIVRKLTTFLGLVPKSAAQGTPASTPVGRSGTNEMKIASKNPDQTTGGRQYAGHALDDMQGRGVPPSAVENIIKNGNESPGKDPGTIVHTSSEGRVVTTDGGKVISVVQFGSKGR